MRHWYHRNYPEGSAGEIGVKNIKDNLRNNTETEKCGVVLKMLVMREKEKRGRGKSKERPLIFQTWFSGFHLRRC